MLKFIRLDSSVILLEEDLVEEIYVEWDIQMKMATGRKWSTS